MTKTTEKGFLEMFLLPCGLLTGPNFVPFDENNVVHRVMMYMQNKHYDCKTSIDALHLTKEDAICVLQYFYVGIDGYYPLNCFIVATRTTIRDTPGGPVLKRSINADERMFGKYDFQQIADVLYTNEAFRTHLREHQVLSKFAPPF
jgi:hypothetical protein